MRPAPGNGLRAATALPDGFIAKPGLYTQIRLVARRLDAGLPDAATRDAAAEVLWALAEELEDGGLADALAAMQQAQERLSEAIRNGASKDEIAKLMQELKEATDRYLEMLAERAPAEEGPQFGQQGPSQQITGDQIQQLMDEIQRLMEEGRMAEAQELLDQLARMMENLQVTQGQGGQGENGNPSMRDLGETLRQQQELSDEAFRELQEGQNGQQQGQGQQQDQGEGEGQGAEGQGADGQGAEGQQGPGGQSLADRQRALRRELGRQQGLMPRLGNEAGNEAQRRLDEAGRAMDGAEEALRRGDSGTAIDRQADAIEALREGMRALGEAMAQERGGNQPGQPGGDLMAGDPSGRGGPGDRMLPRDPLGRSLGEGGRLGATDEMLNGEDGLSPSPRSAGRDPAPLGRAAAPGCRARLSRAAARPVLRGRRGLSSAGRPACCRWRVATGRRARSAPDRPARHSLRASEPPRAGSRQSARQSCRARARSAPPESPS